MENNFGEFLKKKRQEKKLTQLEIAKQLFVSESAVSKWEKNVAHPDITLLPKLAQILDVTEHEIITASIDNESREEKKQAKKWRIFSSTWDLFFYISYITTLITCFICDLAINKTLTWFWIVLSAILLAFTFTNLHKLIKKYKLILLPLSMLFALCLLLGICCIYTKGNWFWVSSLSTLFGLIVVFVPIYISKFKIFCKLKKYCDFISVTIDFISLGILLFIINSYTSLYYAISDWFFSIALPIICGCFIFINLLLCVRFIKTNKLIKTSIILFLIDSLYVVASFIKVDDVDVQKTFNDFNIFKSNFSNWGDNLISNNVHCIIFLTMLALSISFLIFGLTKFLQVNKKNTNTSI